MNVYCKRTLKALTGLVAAVALICVHVGNHGSLTPLMLKNIEALASSSGSGSSDSTGTEGEQNMLCYGTGEVDCPTSTVKVKQVIIERSRISLLKNNK